MLPEYIAYLFNSKFVVLFAESTDILRHIVHYSLHLFAPGLIAWFFFRPVWKKAWLIMLATMLVDLDHFLADQIFVSGRCSIGFHPLHSWYAVTGYAGIMVFSRLRIIGAGLLLHMFTDFIDCLWMGNVPFL